MEIPPTVGGEKVIPSLRNNQYDDQELANFLKLN